MAAYLCLPFSPVASGSSEGGDSALGTHPCSSDDDCILSLWESLPEFCQVCTETQNEDGGWPYLGFSAMSSQYVCSYEGRSNEVFMYCRSMWLILAIATSCCPELASCDSCLYCNIFTIGVMFLPNVGGHHTVFLQHLYCDSFCIWHISRLPNPWYDPITRWFRLNNKSEDSANFLSKALIQLKTV